MKRFLSSSKMRIIFALVAIANFYKIYNLSFIKNNYSTLGVVLLITLRTIFIIVSLFYVFRKEESAKNNHSNQYIEDSF